MQTELCFLNKSNKPDVVYREDLFNTGTLKMKVPSDVVCHVSSVRWFDVDQNEQNVRIPVSQEKRSGKTRHMSQS